MDAASQRLAIAHRAGYADALAKHGLSLDTNLLGCGGAAPEQLARHLARFLALPDPPSGLVVAHHEQGSALGQMLARQCLGVPDTVSLVALDHTPETRMRAPITTVRQPYAEMGQLAAAHLCRVIDGEAPERLALTLAPELVVRASTAPPAAHRWKRAC
jgi:LacI family transcriptional regulator